MATPLLPLIIYAYSSFAAPWGAGPTIVSEFEKTCRCQVKLIEAGDGGSLISRLQLEGDKTEADVIIGIDQNSLDRIKNNLHWKIEPKEFDNGPFAFVYRSSQITNPPLSLDDLLAERWSKQILIEDPRLSTVGLGFLLWVIKEKGEKGAWDFLRKFKKQIKLVSPSWDLAYGMFKKSEAQLVFSYWTSPAYHIQEENRHDFKAAPFKKGNYVQREYLFTTPGDKNKNLKEKFLNFMLGTMAQTEIPKRNFMYPVNKEVKLPPAFKEIGVVHQLPSLKPTQKQIEDWLAKWREIFS